MFQTQYPVPPPQYFPADYHTPPHTPAAGPRHSYYSPRQYAYATTPPSKDRIRRATQDYSYSTYTTPKKSTSYYARPEDYHTSAHSTPQRRSDYVSGSDRVRASVHRHPPVPVHGDGSTSRRYSTSKHYSSRYAPVHGDVDHEYEYLPRYEKFQTYPPPYEHRQNYRDPRADQYRDAQVPVYTPADSSSKSRPRRASYTAKPTYTTHARPRPTEPAKSPRKATEDDARRAGIPAGYSFKNWDPSEEPILLLGSVFDANSLGRWIYDWTVFFYGPATPMSEIAGELWLLLIQLAGKVKAAEDALPRIRQQKDRDMVDDFLDSGERLWQRFNKLLKICENYMWKAAKREAGSSSSSRKNVTMGKNSGCEFVDAIFGRDRELERTEKLMTGIRLWSLRYTANVDPILAYPAA